jgi:hypothetical protein
MEARWEAEDESKAIHARQEQERCERERQETAAQARCQQRRRLIQEVKEVVLNESFVGGIPDIRAQVLQEVERALSPLALDELPRDELLIIARAARDKVCRAAEKVRKEKHDTELQAQQRVQERADRKRRLIRQGIEYAKRELARTEDASALEKWCIGLRVERELQEIAGGESWSEIEDQVEEILESEGIEYDDD